MFVAAQLHHRTFLVLVDLKHQFWHFRQQPINYISTYLILVSGHKLVLTSRINNFKKKLNEYKPGDILPHNVSHLIIYQL